MSTWFNFQFELILRFWKKTNFVVSLKWKKYGNIGNEISSGSRWNKFNEQFFREKLVWPGMNKSGVNINARFSFSFVHEAINLASWFDKQSNKFQGFLVSRLSKAYVNYGWF